MTEPRQDEPPVRCSDCEGLREQLEDLGDKYDALEADAMKLKDDVDVVVNNSDGFTEETSDVSPIECVLHILRSTVNLRKAIYRFENSTGKET